VTDSHPGLDDLVAVVRAEAVALGRDDLAVLLPVPADSGTALGRSPNAGPGRPGFPANDHRAPRRPRIVVAGRTGSGKSRLLNSLIGRPDLSPVGDGPTTAGWIELRYGPDESATAMIADPGDPGSPRRRPIRVGEIAAYATFGEITETVLGVECRLDVPLLREAIFVDTPGVIGPLAALSDADALLFVSDGLEPIPDSDLTFLATAAQRLDTIVVAVSKGDLPGHGAVLAETRRRLAAHPDLGRLPVLAASARLAERAGRPGTPHTAAARLAELSGNRQLVDILLYEAEAAVARLRATGHARLTAAVTRALLADVERRTGPAERIEAEIATITTLLDCGGLLGARFEECRQTAAQRFAMRADELSRRAQASAGPVDALPPRVVIGLATAATAAFDETQEGILDAVRDCLRDDVLVPPASEVDLRLRDPLPAAVRRRDLLHTLTGLLTGSAVVLTVLQGAGVVGADIALSACAGWWRLRDETGPPRRVRTNTWADAAVTEATKAVDLELRRRVLAARRHVADAVPRLLEERRDRLTRLRDDHVTTVRAEASRRTLAQALDDLSRRSTA
jgi:hypothetical protein